METKAWRFDEEPSSYLEAVDRANALVNTAVDVIARHSDGTNIGGCLYLIRFLTELIECERYWDNPVGPKPYRFVKIPIPSRLRKLVFERDEYRCVRCGDWHDLECDHIIPESIGGPTIEENLQTLCRSCNAKKGSRIDYLRKEAAR